MKKKMKLNPSLSEVWREREEGRQDMVKYPEASFSFGVCPRPYPGNMTHQECKGVQGEPNLAIRNTLVLEILYFKKHQLTRGLAAFLIISATQHIISLLF